MAAEGWRPPSPRTRELIRAAGEVVLQHAEEWAEQLHDASLSGERMAVVAGDPVLAEGVRRTNLANALHWTASNISRPGEPVTFAMTPDILAAARDLVRRGLDERALDAFRTGQARAWGLWMQICFDLTDDPAELRELLSVTSASMSSFVDDAVASMSGQMTIERDDLLRGTHADRREAATLVLEGAPISTRRAQERLGYRLSGPHLALVVWGRDADADVAVEVESAVDRIARGMDQSRPLIIVASATSRWLWLPTDDLGEVSDLDDAVAAHPGVSIAVGRPGVDVEGFRTSHFQALTTQRLMSRLGGRHPIARYDETRLVALLTADPAAADDFVAGTLGRFADAGDELITTVRTWISLHCNTTRTAEALYTHRNTVLRRLDRADELLPRPLADNIVDIAACLEVLRWR